MVSETKNIDWQSYFKTLEYTGKTEKDTYLIALDTEYTQDTKFTNICLSYQISALRTEDDEYHEVFLDVQNNERKTLLDLIQNILNLFTNTVVGATTYIKLIAHNSVAEISMLADKNTYAQHLQIIRRTLTTKKNITIDDDGDKYVIELYDSMLIAPVGYYSLKKLGGILGSEDMMKIDITQADLENMDKFKAREPEKFREYAMQDSRVTLAVWLNLQTQYNELVNELITKEKDKKIKYYKTLGSAAVQAFLAHLKYQELNTSDKKDYKEFTKTILNPNYEYTNFINNTYFGGRNESFFIGHTEEYKEIRDKYIFIDIDFSGAYPTGISSIPRVSSEVKECINSNKMIHDWHKRSKNEKNIVIVGFADVEFKFPDGILLPSLPVKHQQYGLIYPLEGETLVTAVEIVFFIEQLKAHDKKVKIDDYISVKKSIELKPILIDDSPDLLLKRYFKNKILKRDEVKQIIKSKESSNEDINKAKLQDKLLKELVNSAYGKFGQSINKKNTYDLTKGITKPLTKSPITAPYIASTTTGIVRAALSALVYTTEAYNKKHKDKLVLISATTDGALLGIPLKSIQNHQDIDYEQPDNIDIHKLLPAFTDILESYYSIQLLKNTRASFEKGYLEVKHLATEVFSVKTRGQIGYLRDPVTKKRKISVLAKFGHKPPLSDIYDKETYKEIMSDGQRRNEADAKWLIRKYKQIKSKDKDIKKYKVRTLIGARKIFDMHEPYKDLVGINVEKKINFDYDYKRLLEDGDPYTKPYKNLKQMLKHRYAMENVRKRGINANSELVEAKVQTNHTNVRIRGSLYDHALKMTLRGIFSKEHNLAGEKKTKAKDAVKNINTYLQNIQAKVKLISEDTIKNAKRLKFEVNTIPNTADLKSFVKNIYNSLDMPFDKSYIQSYFTKTHVLSHELMNPSEKLALKVFLQWLFRFERKRDKRLPIFGKLELPSLKELEKDLIGYIQATEIALDDIKLREYILEAKEYAGNLQYNKVPNTKGSKLVIQQMRLAILKYIPNNRESRSRQTRLLTTRDFNSLLLQRVNQTTVKKNPAKESCLKYFLLAYLNNVDGFNSTSKNKNGECIMKHKNIIIIDRLASFGLNKSKFYNIKRDKFIYKALKDTPENRTQIKNMCKQLDVSTSKKIFQTLLA